MSNKGNIIVRKRSSDCALYEAKLCFKEEDPYDDWVEVGFGETEKEARNDLIRSCIQHFERHKTAYEIISSYLDILKQESSQEYKEILKEVNENKEQE